MANLKVFIIGSCVTRDAFTPNNNEEFTVVDYYARYSLARIPYPKVKVPLELINETISSEFQKRLLHTELSNQILDKLKSSTFDKLIIDCVDDRFGLVAFQHSYVTNSNELIRSQIVEDQSACKITPAHEVFYELWEEGLMKILDVVDVDKIIFNDVYWASRLNSGDEGFNKHSVESGNIMAEKLYAIARKYLPEKQFVSYPRDIFVGDKEHKWEPSPFHYVADVYDFLGDTLRNFDQELNG